MNLPCGANLLRSVCSKLNKYSKHTSKFYQNLQLCELDIEIWFYSTIAGPRKWQPWLAKFKLYQMAAKRNSLKTIPHNCVPSRLVAVQIAHSNDSRLPPVGRSRHMHDNKVCYRPSLPPFYWGCQFSWNLTGFYLGCQFSCTFTPANGI